MSFHVKRIKKMEVSARKNGDNFAFTIGYIPNKIRILPAKNREYENY